jgi:photosystem II stability/assembly factor-like uncharacterized protein
MRGAVRIRSAGSVYAARVAMAVTDAEDRTMSEPVLVGAAPWVAASGAEQKYGLFRSDGGGEWHAVTQGLPEQVQIRALAVDPVDAGTIYAATQAGPYRSRDGGASWTSLELEDRDPCWSVTVHPADARILFAGTTDARIYRSDDAGASWQRLELTLPEGVCRMGFPTRMLRIALDPANPDEIYAALEVGGMVRSLDGGRSWSSCNAGLLAFAREARYQSRIGSDTDSEGMMDSHAMVISRARPGTIFLANRMGLFRSTDRGENWQDMAIGRFSPLTYARDICVSPHDQDTLLGAFSVAAVSDQGSLYRSTDLGESWQRFDRDVAINSTLMTVAASARDPDRVYCAARRGQVFGTEDGGASWVQRPLPAGVEGVYAVACL